ncbi:MAG TPA: ATP phosphoribosyltransferase [Desulfobacter postgatei]|jgi:ATP phosphoribosyltransferase|uniref:ATP phosphoribosyltransferase n=2 Tax=unclassified Desulfobacter TaxID=2634406 RepID=UPI000E8F8BEE|nr:ATP phosphoribosyltransferase [Desulfobacter sp.]MDQ1269540.1 phosphoribosyltransferase [Thermodesulfobacteriota bacterium]HRF89285.1 ATP phosphoribosyltransferase [Desulfobacter postgatei]MBP8829123.1 ATP phosphoribosyltransferase [Desulfobacter sp.]MBP9598029.1 ATP phosphoribosyltransferase [Desulfobacter sp.]HBT89856.1 ATP phosphoribosyltransferase [Desulfobacter sp.]
MNKKLKLGIPKGSLQNATVSLFRRSGWKINVEGRSYFPDIDDDTIECALCRAQEMSINVESGVIDAGLTGLDWVAEHESDVHVVADLIYSKVSSRPARWVVAVAGDSDINNLEDLEGKTISTELVKFTQRYFQSRNINVNVKFSWGATEAKIVSGLADAIVEITETESTIRAHNLKVIHEMMKTNTQLIANKTAWKDPVKREKIEQIAMLLQAALVAEKLVMLKMNVPESKLPAVVELLPSLNAPTVASLYQSDWFSVETVVEISVVRDLVPQLLKAGAEGIIECSLNKVI